MFKIRLLSIFIFLITLSGCVDDGKIKIIAQFELNGKSIPVSNTTFTVIPGSDTNLFNSETIKFTTDQNGIARIELTPGNWNFNGGFYFQGKKLSWVMVDLEVKENTKEFILNQENGLMVDIGLPF